MFFCGRKKAVQTNRNDATKATEKTTLQIANQDRKNSESFSSRPVEDHYIKPNDLVDANLSAYVSIDKIPNKKVGSNHSEYENVVKDPCYENIAYQNVSKNGNEHVYEKL